MNEKLVQEEMIALFDDVLSCVASPFYWFPAT